MKLDPTIHNHFTAADESPSTLLHRLHTNEKQLRALAVVLSLTGGLALSFALGVGIMIYWYCRKCKKKRNPSERYDDDIHDSEDDDDEKSYSTEYSCSLRNCHYFHDTNQEPIVNNSQGHQTVHNSSHTLQDISSVLSQHDGSLHDLLLLPQPPISAIATPEPSAPSAKELHFQINADATSSTNNHQELEELCHDCSIPPPAYTKE